MVISEVVLGNKIIGGDKHFPFLDNKEKNINKPLVAMEIFDKKYENIPLGLKSGINEELTGDTAKWASFCEKECGADVIHLRLSSISSENPSLTPDDEAKLVKSVSDAVSVPLILWASGNPQTDEKYIPVIAKALRGKNILIGPVNQNNFKILGQSAIDNNHGLVIETPLDINIAKQISLSLNNMGIGFDKMIIYPTSGSIGYGFEYAYSISERIRLAGFSGDKYLSLPLMSMPGEVVWGVKEVNEESTAWGELAKRAVSWETVTAFSYIISGANLVVVRHPETVKALKKEIKEILCS